MKKLKTLILLLFALTLSCVSAFGIDAPEELIFNNVLGDGYAEKTINITSKSPDNTHIGMYASGTFSDWVTFYPSSRYVNKDSPIELKVLINPPLTPPGIYTGQVVIKSSGTGRDTTIEDTVIIRSSVEITDHEIVQLVSKKITISESEQGKPIKILVPVQNEGNTVVNPFFKIDILDDNEKPLLTHTSKKTALLPSTHDVIEIDTPHNLEVGRYIIEITTLMDNGWVSGKQSTELNIIEENYISEGPRIIKGKLTPLAISKIMIVSWVFLLLFVTLIIRHKTSRRS